MLDKGVSVASYQLQRSGAVSREFAVLCRYG